LNIGMGGKTLDASLDAWRLEDTSPEPEMHAWHSVLVQ